MYKDKTKEKLYKVWICMKKRCYDIHNTNYKRYGGRGIKICDEWLDFNNFYKWSINNGYKLEILNNGKNKWTIDRINNDGNYEPSNCRYVEFLEQQYNRRNTIYVTYNGKKYNLLELSKTLNISISCLKRRIQRNWDKENLNKRPLIKNEKKYFYDNKYYSLSELSSKYNIPTKILYSRIVIQGWDIKKAIELDKCKNSTKIKLYDFNGEKLCVAEIAKRIGINRTTLNYRLKQENYNLEKALKRKSR